MSLATIFGPHPSDDGRDLRFKIALLNEMQLGTDTERDAVVGQLRAALRTHETTSARHAVLASRDYGEQ